MAEPIRPRVSLITLKSHRAALLRAQLLRFIEQEVAMRVPSTQGQGRHPGLFRPVMFARERTSHTD